MFSVVSQASFENVKDKKLKAKKDIVILDIQVFICNKTIKSFYRRKIFWKFYKIIIILLNAWIPRNPRSILYNKIC